MVNEKERMIKKLGLSATIMYKDNTKKDTLCFVSKTAGASRSLAALESHRKGDFIYSDNVTSGCIVHNNVSLETYIVVAIFNSVFKDKVLSTTTHMLAVNATMSVDRDVNAADKSGNIKKTVQNIVTDQPVFVATVTQELRQTLIGLFPNTDYVIYAPWLDLKIIDRITLTSMGVPTKMKLENLDHTSYPGCLLIQVSTETRV